jgi:hypothetical protein
VVRTSTCSGWFGHIERTMLSGPPVLTRPGRYAGQGSGVSVLPSRALQAIPALIKRVRKVTAVENIEFFCALWLERNRAAGIPSRSSCRMHARGRGHK